MKALIRRLRTWWRVRLAWSELRDEFADHRLALVSPYDDQRIIERWEDVVADLEGELVSDAYAEIEWQRLMALYPDVWHELGGDDGDDLEYA